MELKEEEVASECPHCGRDLTYEVDGTTYSRAVSVEIRGVYDGGLFYADAEEGGCRGAWHRWPEGHRLHAKAQLYIDQWDARKNSES